MSRGSLSHVDVDCCRNVIVVSKGELLKDELSQEHSRCPPGVPAQCEPADDIPPVGILSTSLCGDVTDVTVKNVKVHGDSAEKNCIDGQRQESQHKDNKASVTTISLFDQSLGALSFHHFVNLA